MSSIQDAIADLETNVSAVDNTGTEVSAAVDGLTDDVRQCVDSVAMLRTDIQILSAQMASLHATMSEIKAAVGR